MMAKPCRTMRFGAAAWLLAAAAVPAAAGEKEDLEALRATTLGIIQALVDQGWITKEKAAELIKQAQKTPPPAGVSEEVVKDGTEEKVVRVPYVPEMVRQEIYDKVKTDVLAQAKTERWGDPGAIPDWVTRLKMSGDLRVRAENDRFASTNAPYQNFWSVGQQLNNTTEDRDRLRLRGRLAIDATVADRWSMQARVATCQANDPLCIDANMGTDTNRSEIRLDRAFLSYQDNTFRADFGRINNPFLSTDLVFNSALGFDGIAANYKYKWTDDVTQFLTGGVFPLQDIQRSSTISAHSKWLYAAQTGADMKLGEHRSVRLGLGLYDFHNIEGKLNSLGLNDQSASAPSFRQKGNSLFYIDQLNSPQLVGTADPSTQAWGIASKFRVVNLTAIGDLADYDPVHVMLIGDYAKNVGFNHDEILARTGLNLDKKTTAWHLRAQVGHPVVLQRGDWQAFIAYKYVEPDAVVDAFTDSDFRGGGTDAKGYVLGGSYGLDKNVWLTLRYFSAQSTSAFVQNPPFSEDILQIDLNARF